ncbi:uncharacterized protein LOC115312887 [Ixodes scapularis]|uniref:uncharacterized protein LOC115312887 n=1 Tax=Ixodes scapularis TaxID=6945 RepID=UPI001A9EAB79|nr:uncharacterized protein LOC115312887 [Ixodes scapularis]
MDKVAELANPDDVVDAQDLVVLKLDRPWSGPHAVPAGCVLDSCSQRITTNQKSFVANKDNLTKQRFSAALFAGCSAFATYTALSNAAVEVLKKAETLVLVHNRDLVMDLVQRFPGLRLLVLMHDLRLQTEAKHRLDVCGKRSSRLRQVVGTAPALGMDHLFLCPVTLISLLANCDMLCEIQAPMEEVISLSNPLLSGHPGGLPPFKTGQELILGSHAELPDGPRFAIEHVGAEHIASAQPLYVNLKRLTVTAASRETLARIADFEHIRRLSITFSADAPLCPFGGHVVRLLKKFDLDELSLCRVDQVQLSIVARFCKDLRSLAFSCCNVNNETFSNAFPKLERLSVGRHISSSTLRSLLAACPNLTGLELTSDDTCAAFLDRRSSRPTLANVMRLVLNTAWTVEDLGTDADTMRSLLKSLPALRHVVTDSYGLRLFFENYAPHVRLSWTGCVVCTAEFPKVSELQELAWTAILSGKV